MGGLAVLALLGLYVWGAYKAVALAKPRWAKVLVTLVIILIPTADAVYGRIRLRQMCETEGGLHIYRVVEGAEGFDDPESVPYEQWLKEDGYKFVEGVEIGGKRSRLRRQQDGKLIREVGISPISEYIYEMDPGNYRNIYDRSGSQVRVRNTGEILSRDINVNYAGGWFERFVNGIYAARGTAGTCGPIVSKHELVTRTLKPIK